MNARVFVLILLISACEGGGGQGRDGGNTYEYDTGGETWMGDQGDGGLYDVRGGGDAIKCSEHAQCAVACVPVFGGGECTDYCYYNANECRKDGWRCEIWLATEPEGYAICQDFFYNAGAPCSGTSECHKAWLGGSYGIYCVKSITGGVCAPVCFEAGDCKEGYVCVSASVVGLGYSENVCMEVIAR